MRRISSGRQAPDRAGGGAHRPGGAAGGAGVSAPAPPTSPSADPSPADRELGRRAGAEADRRGDRGRQAPARLTCRPCPSHSGAVRWRSPAQPAQRSSPAAARAWCRHGQGGWPQPAPRWPSSTRRIGGRGRWRPRSAASRSNATCRAPPAPRQPSREAAQGAGAAAHPGQLRRHRHRRAAHRRQGRRRMPLDTLRNA